MSLTGTLSNAFSGLNAAQSSINSVAHNIVNANTDGYVRKTLGQSSLVLQNRGAGVEVGMAERIADEFLIEEARRQATITGKSLVLDRYHSLAQDAFGNPASSYDMGSLIGTLSASLEAFTSDHETSALGRDVLNSASELTDTIDQLTTKVQRLRGEADQEIERLTKSITADLKAIDTLNVEIARVRNAGDVNPELYDKRDLLVKQLSEKIEIGTYSQGDGVIAIYTGRGEALLDATPGSFITMPAAASRPTPTCPPCRSSDRTRSMRRQAFLSM